MKITIKMILGGLVALGTHLSFAGTPVPNYYYQQDVQNLQVKAQVRPQVQDQFSVWCEDRLFILRNARTEASRAVFRGNYSLAVATLINGLEAAARDGYHTNPPLTQTLIVRGEVLGKSLLAHVSREINGVKAVNLFLENYYDLIENMAQRVDIPYFIPGTCGYCNHRDSTEFERNLIELARMQVSLVNDALLFNGTMIPIGPSSLYLKALEMMSYFASFDLRSSLFSNFYSCQIRSLEVIHAKLRSFNSVVTPEFAKKEMIMTIVPYVERVVSELSYTNRCH